MRTALATALALLTLAGCVAPGADVAPAAVVPTLDDALAAIDAGEPLANLQIVGEWRNGSGAEVAAHEGLLYVMRGGGVTVLNVSAPSDITEVAEIRGAHGVLDVKLSEALKVNGTPVFAVGRRVDPGSAKISHVLTGARPIDAFRAVLNEVLK